MSIHFLSPLENKKSQLGLLEKNDFAVSFCFLPRTIDFRGRERNRKSTAAKREGYFVKGEIDIGNEFLGGWIFGMLFRLKLFSTIFVHLGNHLIF